MIIEKGPYRFLVDVEKTKEYYHTHSLCDCVCCCNYYAQIKNKLPGLDLFLSGFGVDISKPDELLSVETNTYVDYLQADYTVCGQVEIAEEDENYFNDNLHVEIHINNGFVSPNEQKGAYFTISVIQIQLPWVIDYAAPIKEEPERKKLFRFFRSVMPNNDDQARIKQCYDNIKNKLSMQCNDFAFIEKDDWIAFAGTAEEPALQLTLSVIKTDREICLYADLDNEVSWQEWDFENQDDFENDVVKEIALLFNRTIKTVKEMKKHQYIKVSRYFLNENNQWILIDEDRIDCFWVRIFVCKNRRNETIQSYKLLKS